MRRLTKLIHPKRWRPELMVLVALAVITRTWQLLQPNAVVFDEVYFKAFAGHYLDGRYFFDIHPPLGKLLLAGWGHLLGLTSTQLVDGTAVLLRFAPALAGVLIVPVFWGILRRLGASRAFALIGAAALLLDNALLVESRFILVDSMLIVFGLGALYFYLVARDVSERPARWAWLVLAALLAGAAASTKWTGLTALALVGLLWIADQIGSRPRWGRLLGELAVLVVVPVMVYVGAFWVHFQLLPHSGDGDAFMSTQFQATLVGGAYYDPKVHLSFWDKFVQLNQEMYRANQTLTATHPYGSRWYTWPLELRPIYYWEGTAAANGSQGNIYLLGNPVVWWGTVVAVVGGLGYVWVARVRLRRRTKLAMAMAAVAYLMNYLPFVGVTRVMFLYHYFFAFIFSVLFAVMLWDDLASRGTAASRRRWMMVGAVLVVIALGFVWFAPLSYGTPLSPAGLQARMWLPSWR